MAAVSYSPTTYNKLPDLAAAGADFDAKNGDDLIPSFRELFLRHNLDRVFGLSLLHRHFDMEPHERLVEYRGTSVPWAQSLAKSAKPTNWVLEEDDGFRPFEFHYSLEDAADTPDSPQDPKYATFIKDFKELLEQKNAADLFGLCSYPGDDFEGRVEITEARANINLLPKDAPAHILGRQAAWFFSPTLWGSKCVCICGGDGHTTATHQGHVPDR